MLVWMKVGSQFLGIFSFETGQNYFWNENKKAQPIGQLQQMHCIQKQLLQSCFQIGPDDNFCPKP